MNDDIDLTYSQKINSVILTNQEIIDVTTIRENSINQITEALQKYLNDIQTTLIDVSNHKIMTSFFSELIKKKQ